MESKDMNDSINRIMSASSPNAYLDGVASLKQAGYESSSFQLFVRHFFSGTAFFAFLFLLLVILYLLIRLRRNNAYSREVQEVVDWTNGPLSEWSEEYIFKYIPPTVIMSISSLKKQLNRQKVIHDEDTARIMEYMENISHQLKTPLAVIGATCERLCIHHPDIEERLIVCLAQTDKMAALIQDFLQLGRFDCNKQKMQFEYIPAVNLIETVINNLDIVAKKKQLEITECGEKDILWYCDIFWMEEILGNILKNCIEHSEKGAINITFGLLGSMNQIVIRDCGLGLKEGLEKKIFERYSSINRINLEGSGLGLSIAQQAMKLHFGTITASNRQEAGVEFRLSFPQLNPETIYS
ncbi:sensor histidine kinase [Parasporobacterium paucivorans]|nr:HAMP domain-containing sensor histidine kinase [Parasporobacterium paucivorans]